MPIVVQWEDATGKRMKRSDGLYLMVDDLERAPGDSACLRFIDPYGHTVFNQMQLPELIRELESVGVACTDPADSDRIASVVRFAREADGQVHTYLRFIGD